MEIMLAISIARAIAAAGGDFIALYSQVKATLEASDEPAAKAALADLKAAYERTGAEADAALDEVINRGEG